MSFVDKPLICRDCGQEFSFTAGEQEFYAQRGFTNEPSRCPDCRAARKASGGSSPRGRSAGGSSYGSSGSSGGGYGNDRGGSYGNDRGGSYGDRAPRQMYTATCSSCGREAQVPFQPTAGKPVYCSDCFAQQRSSRY